MLRSGSIVIGIVMVCGIIQSIHAQQAENLLAVRQAIQDGFNAHDLDQVISNFTDDFTAAHGWNTEIKDAQGFKTGWENVIAAYPDVKFTEGTILVSVSEKIVIEEMTMEGTFTNEYKGMQPTGEKSATRYLNVLEFEGDKVKHLMMYLDQQTTLINAKLMPPMEMPPVEPSFTIPDPEPRPGMTPIELFQDGSVYWNAHDEQNWIKGYTEEADIYANVGGGGTFTRLENAALMTLHWTGFPDAHFEIDRLIDMGDGWVLAEMIFQGTHTGPWFGIPATGHPYKQLPIAQIIHYNSEGLAVFDHAYYDNLWILSQIGVFPPRSSHANQWNLYR